MSTQMSRTDMEMESYSLRNMYLSVFVVKMLYIYIGMTLVWTSPMIPSIQTSLQISLAEQVTISASLPLGMMLGPFSGGYLVARYGYRSIIWLNGSLSVASALFIAFHSPVFICIGRLTAGLSIGAILCHMNSYIEEIADTEVRALMSPLTLIFLSLGFYLIYDIGQSLFYHEILLMNLVVPAVSLACLTWLPESPYHHVDGGNVEQAKKSVDFLRRGISTRGLDHLTQLIQEDVRKRQSETIDWSTLWSNLDHRKSLGVSLVFAILLQLSGFPIVFMLTETLLFKAQLELSVSTSLSAIGVTVLCASVVSFFLNWYCSNKFIVVGSSVIMALSLAVLGIHLFYLEIGEDVSDVLWIPLICIVLYMSAFLIGFANKSDAVMSVPQLRELGRTFTMTVSYLCMFLVAALYFPVTEVVGTAPVLWTFAAFATVMAFFIGLHVPETAFL